MEEKEHTGIKISPSWRGFPIKAVYGDLEPFDLEHFSPVQVSPGDAVLYNFPIGVLDINKPPIPYKTNEMKWDELHVRLPNAIESNCQIFDESGNASEQTRNRWELIHEALSSPITSSKELQSAILMYNPKFKDLWNFKGLYELLNEEFNADEEKDFFENLLPRIIRLALQLPELIQAPIPFLKQNKCRSLSLTQQQVSCLLANAFLCTFPQRNTIKRRSEDKEYRLFPEINFHRLFQLNGPMITQKLKCLLHYFDRVCPTTTDASNVPTGVVTFIRRSLDLINNPDWFTHESLLGDTIMHIDAYGVIENAVGLLQVDFANKYIGGGVLGAGCVQEEIRFITSPELIVSKLFTECLRPNEALFMIGCEQFSGYSGYSSCFKWTGDHIDTTPRDSSKRRMVQLVAIDALSFRQPEKQYKEEFIYRELDKAYVGFLHQLETPKPGIATGNWGCGAYRGDPRLKALIQLMVCSVTERPLAYYTFYDASLRDEIFYMYEFLRKHKVRVCDLLHVLLKFESSTLDAKELYSFIKSQLGSKL